MLENECEIRYIGKKEQTYRLNFKIRVKAGLAVKLGYMLNIEQKYNQNARIQEWIEQNLDLLY